MGRKMFAIATECIVLGPKLEFGLAKETSIFAFLSKAEKNKGRLHYIHGLKGRKRPRSLGGGGD